MSDARGARASATLAPPGVMCTRGLFTQVGLGPGAFWASAGPKCAVGSNTGRGLAVTMGRGLEMCRGLEVVAFAAWSEGVCPSKPRLFQPLEAGAFLPPDVTLFTATVGGFFIRQNS